MCPGRHGGGAILDRKCRKATERRVFCQVDEFRFHFTFKKFLRGFTHKRDML